MIMFLSSFYGIIDSKNRVAIPSSFRSTISNSKEKIYIFKSLKYECLELHLSSKINALIKTFDEKDFFSKYRTQLTATHTIYYLLKIPYNPMKYHDDVPFFFLWDN